MRAIRRMGLWLGIGILGLVAAAGMAAADEIQLPPGPNRELVYGACRTCHDLGYLVESAGIGREDWDSLINGMRQYGLRIPPAERAKILDYLGTYLGPHPPPAGAATAAAAPEAVDGSKIFATQCTACHQPDGKGLPGHFPPLAGNHDLFRDRLLPVYVLLNGLSGAIAGPGQSLQRPDALIRPSLRCRDRGRHPLCPRYAEQGDIKAGRHGADRCRNGEAGARQAARSGSGARLSRQPAIGSDRPGRGRALGSARLRPSQDRERDRLLPSHLPSRGARLRQQA